MLWRISSLQNENSVIFYSPSSCFKPLWICFFCWTQRKIFWRMPVTKQLIDPIDFNSIFFLLWKSMGSINRLITNILQNIFLCLQQKKKIIQVWNNLRVSKWWPNFHFEVNYSFKMRLFFFFAFKNILCISEGLHFVCFKVMYSHSSRFN